VHPPLAGILFSERRAEQDYCNLCHEECAVTTFRRSNGAPIVLHQVHRTWPDAAPKCVICTNLIGLDTMFCFLADSNGVPAE
jgi:hypothetical protein